MIRIGIELNGIVRDINGQILKYYKKDLNPDFDDKNIDKNVTNVAELIDFGSKKKRYDFLYVDYPYEVYGCAKTCSRNLSTKVNQWLVDFSNTEDEDYEIVFFSTKEDALTIQSTYYFLSKIGCRVREMHFPKDGAKMWDICDVIITCDGRIVKSKPKGKKCILISKTDNASLVNKCDMAYDSLEEIITDEFFLANIKEEPKKVGILKKIKNIFS